MKRIPNGKRRSLPPAGILLALLVGLGAGCASQPHPKPPPPGVRHRVVGVWEYEEKGEVYRVEFTQDGKCIMYRGRPARDEKTNKRIFYPDNGEAYRVCDYQIVTPRKVMVFLVDRQVKQVPYEVLNDGRLNVENRSIATRIR